MFVVGILGGIASGKSTITRMLEEKGAKVLDVDKIARAVLQQSQVKDKLRQRWGGSIFDESGEVQRHKIAQLVFQQNEEGEENLRFLEATTHPLVSEQLAAILHELQSLEIVIILDAAVMLKAGWQKHCDTILFVDADDELRLARAKTRGWSKEEFHNREARQESLEYKKSLAQTVINNGADLAETQNQIDQFWQTIPT